MNITSHAVDRFQERTGCRDRKKARQTIKSMFEKSTKAVAHKRPDGSIEFFPKDLFCYNGWVLVAEGKSIITVYMAKKDNVLPPK